MLHPLCYFNIDRAKLYVRVIKCFCTSIGGCSHLRNKSLLLRMIVFGCLLSVIPVFIIGGFSFITATTEVQRHVNQGKMHFIKQMNSNIEQILVANNHSLNKIVETSLMKTVLSSDLTAHEFKLFDEIRAELIRLQSFETKVSDVVLLNTEHHWVLKNSGKYDLYTYPNHEYLLSFFDHPHNTAWALTPQSQFMGELSNRAEDVQKTHCEYNISLVKQLPLRAVKASQRTGLLFANIPTCAIIDIISYDEASEEIMIVDTNMQIIVHVDVDMIGKSLYETGYFTENIAFPHENDQFDIVRDGDPYTITYHKSDLNGWVYISATSLDALTAPAKRIGWLTIYICLIIIIVSIVLISIMSNRVYSPVHNLIKFIREFKPDENVERKSELQLINEQFMQLFTSNSELQSELSHHAKQVRSIFLSRLYLGNLKPAEFAENIEYFGFSDKITSWEMQTVFVLQIDSLDNTRYQPKDYELLLFAITNIVEETIPHAFRLPSEWLEQTLVCVCGSSDMGDEQYHSFILNLAENIQNNIEKYLTLSVSIGISLPYKNFKNTSRAYQEGMEALKHRMTLGKQVIIHFSSINSGKHSIIHQYPDNIEAELLDAIKIVEKDKAIELLREWTKQVFLPKQSVREHQISMVRLLNHLLIAQQEAGITYEQINVQNESLYEELLSLHIVEQIEQWFKERLVLPLIEVFSSRRDSQYHNLSEQIIHMIHNSYDSDITLEQCAAKLHYNANYLSSVFKKETNYTFSEYLTMYRLRIGKEWLIETDMTIKEIAERLQYNNPQNYIRSFRKQEGMTPGQYRAKYSKEG